MPGDGADDDWVTAAMADDDLVVDLLVRLHAEAPLKPRPAVPLEWSVRQRRSRSLFIADGLNKKKKKARRASPSTPLTWSGATSLSGGSGGSGGGGYEQSSGTRREKLSVAARSEIIGECEKSSSKRPRKKKTPSELRDEESSLLNERRELKREISKMRMHLQEQRSKNEKLKRMKIEQQQPLDQESPSTAGVLDSYQSQQRAVLPQQSISHASQDESHSQFMLPDLNMPFEEEEPQPELISGISFKRSLPLMGT